MLALRYSRSSTRATCTADHSPRPRALGMQRSFNAAAMARSDVAPAACISAIVGAMSDARTLARAASSAASRGACLGR